MLDISTSTFSNAAKQLRKKAGLLSQGASHRRRQMIEIPYFLIIEATEKPGYIGTTPYFLAESEQLQSRKKLGAVPV